MNVPVCLFARPPVAGVVKTRLAAAVGETMAARVADALLRDAIDAVRAADLRPVWASTEAVADVGVELWLQGDGDLGARLEAVLARGVAEAGGALAVGPDTLGLDPAVLRQAVDAVRAGRPCLGPAVDGGFWCLGLPRVPRALLVDVPWSDRRTGEVVWDRLTKAFGEVVLLPERRDVDEVGDLEVLWASPWLHGTSQRVLELGHFL